MKLIASLPSQTDLRVRQAWEEMKRVVNGLEGGGATLPINESDVTGLVADLAALTASIATKAVLPIGEADVTGLVADLAALTASIAAKASLPIAEADVIGLVANLAAINAATALKADTSYVVAHGIRRIGICIDGGVSAITTGVKGYIQADFAGTIIGWSCEADQVGDLQVEISKRTGTQALPVRPNEIADKISASAPIALAAAEAAGAGPAGVSTWSTTAVALWDTVQFNVTVAATITRATLYLRIQES